MSPFKVPHGWTCKNLDTFPTGTFRLYGLSTQVAGRGAVRIVVGFRAHRASDVCTHNVRSICQHFFSLLKSRATFTPSFHFLPTWDARHSSRSAIWDNPACRKMVEVSLSGVGSNAEDGLTCDLMPQSARHQRPGIIQHLSIGTCPIIG